MNQVLDAKSEQRLAYFATLPQDWYDIGIGQVITSTIIQAARNLLIHFFQLFPVPYLFPSTEGSISVEWHHLTDYPLTIDVHDDHYDCSAYIQGDVVSFEFGLDQIEEAREWCLQFHNRKP